MAAQTFFCIDAHTCGNPVRVVAGGGPRLEGKTMMERRAHFLSEFDWVRTGLMFEPRGHEVMSGSILYPPTREDCDIGILFIEVSGCLPMCGHGTIGTVTVMIEHGLVRPRTPGVLRLDTPAGLVVAEYKQVGPHVESVKLTNVPGFLHSRDIADFTAGDLVRLSPILRRRLNEVADITHPENPGIKGISHILWTGAPRIPEATARNAVFYGDKAIDRSPCGTGTSARMAQRHAKGLLKQGDAFIHESIIGSLFVGGIAAKTMVADRPAIIPTIEGWARVTGLNTIFIDDRDPYAHGFLLS